MTAPAAPRRPLLWPTIIALPSLLVLLALGAWQLQRLEWKEALIEARRSALAAPPIAAPRDFDPAAHVGRRVRLEGAFRHDREFYSALRSRDRRPGIWVITPFALDDGALVLVDRGWVPADRKDPAGRAAGQVTGRVAVEGVIRAPQRPGFFTPANQPADNIWFTIDPAAMAAAAGLAGVRPYFVEAGPAANPGGLPIGRAYRVDARNDHLQYALTWFALAVALVVIYILYARRSRA